MMFHRKNQTPDGQMFWWSSHLDRFKLFDAVLWQWWPRLPERALGDVSADARWVDLTRQIIKHHVSVTVHTMNARIINLSLMTRAKNGENVTGIRISKLGGGDDEVTRKSICHVVRRLGWLGWLFTNSPRILDEEPSWLTFNYTSAGSFREKKRYSKHATSAWLDTALVMRSVPVHRA